MCGDVKHNPPEKEGHRWVVGYEGRYSATRCGELYGWRVKDGTIRGRVLGWITKGGRNRVELWSSPQKVKKVDIARCILSAHTGRNVLLEPLMALHNDGNPLNNHIDNLRWGDHTDNQADAVMHGTQSGGTTTNEQRAEIVLKFKTGKYTQKSLADEYGVSARAVRKYLESAGVPPSYKRRK